MKAYMAYDGGAGPAEGAILIFAPNHKRARALAWPTISDLMCCEYIDMRCHSLRGEAAELARQNGVTTDAELVLESPACCERCEQWGRAMDEQGICADCRAAHGFDPGHGSEIAHYHQECVS